MSTVFVVTAGQRLAESLERYLRYRLSLRVTAVVLPDVLSTSDKDGSEKPYTWVSTTFHKVADAIEAGVGSPGSGGLKDAVAFIELFDGNLTRGDSFTPVANDVRWAAVVAMLSLAFPELHWIYWTTQPIPDGLLDDLLFEEAHLCSGIDRFFEALERCLGYHAQGYRPLFDPTGFRDKIRRITKRAEWADASYLPERSKLAAAIDEEGPYAYLNAYVAYRLGYRVYMVTTNSFMEELFKKNSSGIELLLEDLFLNFPDRGEEKHYSILKERDEKFPSLEKANQRIFITVGHRRTLSHEQIQENAVYLREWRKLGRRYKRIFKPVSGIYNLQKDAGLGKVNGFEWPPPKLHRLQRVSTKVSHSAPGRLLVIAARLIQRAERILESTLTVEDSIYGALLALEAQEYLGNRTPTTALDALSIRQQLEVTAESMFYGVEAHLNVKDRFREIEEEVHSIGYWFNPDTRKPAELNAQAGIVNKLIVVFRNYNQFDEEQECLCRARKLERGLALNDRKAVRRFFALIAHPFRWYIESLLSSIRWFVGALGLWTAFFTVAYMNFCRCANPSWRHGLVDTMTSFVGLAPPHEVADILKYPALFWLCASAIGLGFLHLGVFIAHLYSTIVRR
jgi:hypothetical protein